jgi:hypothetical protein
LPPGLSANGSGQITGTISAGGAGVYSVTATVSDGTAQDVEVFTWRVISFTASPTTVNSSSKVAAIIGSAPGGVTDYVTLAVAGTANNVFVAKKYLNGQAVPPGAPITDATVSFDIGGGSGNYELRFFRNDTTTLFAMAPVTVTANQPPQVTAIANRSDAVGVAVNVPVTATDPDRSYANAVLSAAPAGYWKLTEVSGTTATDASGNGHTLAHVNTPTLGVAGAVDASTAVTLNGVDEYIHTVGGVGAGLRIAGAITLEAWFKTTKPDHSEAGIAGYGIGSNMQVTLHNSTVNCYLLKNGSGSSISYTSGTLVDGAWHSVTCTWNGTTGAAGLNLYVDGVPRASTASSTAAGGTWAAFLIGRAASHFQGSLDDVAVYGAALTAAQVLAHHESRTLSYSATNLPPGVTINAATGVMSGSPTTTGVYNVTVTVTDGVTPIQRGFTWTVTGTPTVTLSSTSVAGGSTITATVANGPGSRFDWVGFYPVANTHPGFLPPFKYLNNQQTPPPSGLAGGAVEFTVPVQPGLYNVRFFANDSYTLLATSATLTVNSAATITASTAGVMAGGSASGTVANGPGNRFDWVGLYATTASSSGYLNWKYLNGTQSAPDSGMNAATVPFAMPLTPGVYHLRLYSNDSYNLLATTSTISVPAVVPATTTIGAGSSLTTTVTYAPGVSRYDWVGLYSVGSSPSGYIAWKYLSNSQVAPGSPMTNGNVSFPMPTTPGQYNLRFFANDSYVQLGTSATVNVTSASTVTPQQLTVAPGAQVTVSVANGPGGRFDWVGLYSNGVSTSGYITYLYLNGTQTAPDIGVNSAGVTFTMPTTPGTYNFQFYSNASYNLLATSAVVTVQ